VGVAGSVGEAEGKEVEAKGVDMSICGVVKKDRSSRVSRKSLRRSD
jgi:hypothetical protein